MFTVVALPFAVLAIGGCATDIGLVEAANLVPLAIFLLAGGVWADRLPRQRVMLAADFLRVALQLVAAVLLVSGVAHVWHLAVLQVAMGGAEAFFRPAAIGLVPQVVSPGRGCARPTPCRAWSRAARSPSARDGGLAGRGRRAGLGYRHRRPDATWRAPRSSCACGPRRSWAVAPSLPRRAWVQATAGEEAAAEGGTRRFEGCPEAVDADTPPKAATSPARSSVIEPLITRLLKAFCC